MKHVRLNAIQLGVAAFFAGSFLVGGSLYWWDCHRKLVLLDTRISRLQQAGANLERNTELLHGYWRTHSALSYLTRGRMGTEQEKHTAALLWRMSRDYHFDPLLILAVAATESRGHVRAEGKRRSGEPTGAIGLMQIKPSVAHEILHEIGFSDTSSAALMRPEVNIAAGALYLVRLTRSLGDVRRAIMAYNLGPAALRGGASKPWRYLNRVFSNYRALDRLFPSRPSQHIDTP